MTVDNATHANNADAATKAQKDWNNQIIHDTYLKLSGGTMSGALTVSNSSPSINGKTTATTRGYNPVSSVSRNVFSVLDNSNNYLASLNKSVATNGESWTKLIDYDHQDGTQHYIGVGHNSAGSVLTYAPTPSASSNDTTIATTAFVQGLFNKTKDYVVQESLGASGYIKFNSGLILQWVTAGSGGSGYNHSRNISLPISFPNTVYYYSGNNVDNMFGMGDRYMQYPPYSYKLSCSKTAITQTLNPIYDGEGGYYYPNDFPAFMLFAIGK